MDLQTRIDRLWKDLANLHINGRSVKQRKRLIKRGKLTPTRFYERKYFERTWKPRRERRY